MIFSGTIDRSYGHSIRGQELMVSVVGVLLEVIKHWVVPDPWFDHHNHVLLPPVGGLEEFLAPSRDHLICQIVQVPEAVPIKTLSNNFSTSIQYI